MADQQKILNWLQDPDLLDDAGAREIKLLVDTQAYFQPYYFLLLRYYKKYNTWEYEKLLKKYALQIFDRRRLFLFLHDTAEVVTIEKPDAIKSENVVSSVIVEAQLPVDEVIENIATDIVSEESEPQRRDDKDTLEEALSDALQHQVIGNTQVQEKSILPDVSFELDENFEIVRPNNSEDILFTSVSENRDSEEMLLIDDKDLTQSESEPIEIDLPIASETPDGVVLDMHEELPDDASLFEKTETDESETDGLQMSEALAFNAWLDQVESVGVTEHDEEKTGNSIKTGSFDLIDKFLQEDPRIKPKPLADKEQQGHF